MSLDNYITPPALASTDSVVTTMATQSMDFGNEVQDISSQLTAGNLDLGSMIALQIKLQMATAKLDIIKGCAKVLTSQMSKVGQELKQIG